MTYKESVTFLFIFKWLPYPNEGFYFEASDSRHNSLAPLCPGWRAARAFRVRSRCFRQRGAGFVFGADLRDKMATAGFAEHRASQADTAAEGSRSRPGTAGAVRCRSGSGQPDNCSACSECRCGSGPACPRSLARRVPGGEERTRRRSDPEKGIGRAGKRDSESRRGQCG